jgi:hypothetical protein
MKKIICVLVILCGSINIAVAQHSEVRDLEAFSKVNLDGNAKLYLMKSDETSVKLDVKKERYLEDFVSEVRNGELFLYFKKKRRGNQDRKIKVYLKYTDLNKIDLDGFVTLSSDSVLAEEELMIKGDGFIKGKITVSVKDLIIDLDGFTRLTVSGRADTADLKIDGFGKIDANELQVSSVRQDSDGFSRIKVGSDR